VVNGVDPNPSDGYDENGSNIRGEQNIGRDGGVGTGRPQGEVGSGPPASTVVDEVLGRLLHANPYSRVTG
jgi:phospholipid/cholesterol/gamma-HCH transport system substrate-binding protein